MLGNALAPTTMTQQQQQLRPQVDLQQLIMVCPFLPRNHQRFTRNPSAQTFCARIQMNKKLRMNSKA
jgi:hypothetical protein